MLLMLIMQNFGATGAQFALQTAARSAASFTTSTEPVVVTQAPLSATAAAGSCTPTQATTDTAVYLPLILVPPEGNGLMANTNTVALPPSPQAVAPPLPAGVPSDIYDATQFLYTGSTPIQTGVKSNTIARNCVAVLRGKVMTRDNKPLPGVEVTILDHPEWGQTLSRADGMFDMVVNGGGLLVVNYHKSGMLSAQRQIQTRWRDYFWLPDVILIGLDSKVTPITFGPNSPIQVARGTPQTDASGRRQATLLFQPGTTAEMVLPNGTRQSTARLNMRATEFTVGAGGPQAMPAILPPQTAYTYAAEFTADEALAAGDAEVSFNKPIVNYLENFLDFPVGSIVPAGTYDRTQGVWIAASNGRVIKVLSVAGGSAQVDLNGDGKADDSAARAHLGITAAELQQLARLYPAGQTLWRVAMISLNPNTSNAASTDAAADTDSVTSPVEDVAPANDEATSANDTLRPVSFTRQNAATNPAATLKADYTFNGTRGPTAGTAPAFVDVGPVPNTFATESVDGSPRKVLTWPKGNGIALAPTTAVIPNDHYSLVLRFRLDETSGYRRLIDFKNGVGENGLYVNGGQLRFYGATAGGASGGIVPNSYVELTLTRAADRTVTAYIDGVKQFSFVDTNDLAKIDGNNRLRFFIDNGNENSAGAVTRIRLFDDVIDVGPMPPTRTPTPSRTPSPTSTKVGGDTTSTPTATKTGGGPATRTATPSRTVTPSSTSVTPTGTQPSGGPVTRTPTPSKTVTPSPTNTATPSATPSRTVTPTGTGSPTRTPTATKSPTPTRRVTPTTRPTETRTPEPKRQSPIRFPWDLNWPFGPPPDAQPPDGKLKQYQDRRSYGPCPPEEGSVILCESQVLGESYALLGSPFNLNYMSDRVPGRTEAYSLRIPLSGEDVPASLKRIELEVFIAGQKYTETYTTSRNQEARFTWNGRDAYGRIMQGSQMATVRIGYVYPASYLEPNPTGPAFGTGSSSGVSISRDLKRMEITIWEEIRDPFLTTLGITDPRSIGLGGWTLNVHHAYDPTQRMLLRGDGTRFGASALGETMSTYAGNGILCTVRIGETCGDGGQAKDASIYATALDMAADGTLYFVGTSGPIRKISPDGVISTLPGDTSGAYDIVALPDGSLYVANQGQIWRQYPNGTRTLVAGAGDVYAADGDGGPATKANLGQVFDIDVGPDGSLYISARNRVRRVGTDGIIRTVAGDGRDCNVFPMPDACGGGDGDMATNVSFFAARWIAVAPDGVLYILDDDANVIRRVGVDGRISTYAGRKFNSGLYGDGGPAIDGSIATFSGDMEVGPDGTLYLADMGNERIRTITTDGIINTIAGYGRWGNSHAGGFNGDGGPATMALMNDPSDVTVGPDGALYVADNGNRRIRRIGLPQPGTTGTATQTAHTAAGATVPIGHHLIASEDGAEVYEFDTNYRHLRTFDALTGAVMYTFGYDAAGRLSSVTGAWGNTTTIAHDANGTTATITAPGGQRTTLTLNAAGWLTTINGGTGTQQLTYQPNGLLASLQDPAGQAHSFTYDPLGYLVKDSGPNDRTTTITRTLDGPNVSVKVSTAAGQTTTYAVSRRPSGALERVTTDPSGGQTTLVMEPNGNREITYPDGSTATLAYEADPRWRTEAPLLSSLTVKTPSGKTTTQTASRKIQLANAADPFSMLRQTDTITISGKVYTSTYEPATRRLTSRSPEGRESVTTLDAFGRVAARQSAPGLDPTLYTYDAKGRVSQVQQGQQKLIYGYDARNRIATRADAAGNTITYSYDTADRMTEMKLPGGRIVKYQYDTAGNPKQVTMPDGAQHALAYTSYGRLQSYTPPGNAAYRSTYDKDQMRTGMTFPSGRTISYPNDAAGRPAGDVAGDGSTILSYVDATMLMSRMVRNPGNGGTAQAIGWTYDGELTTEMAFSGSANARFRYRYGDDLQLVGLTIDNQPEIAVRHDNDGLITGYGSWTLERKGPNGTLSTAGDATGALHNTYDRLGRLASRSYAVRGKTMWSLALTYNTASRLTQVVETRGSTKVTSGYTYDKDGQLKEVRRNGTLVEAFTYDANGNRLTRRLANGTTEKATYDAQDRLKTRGSLAYSYTADGALSKRGGDTFTYNTHGELASVKLANGQQIQYTYDGWGRRVSRTDTTGTLQYLYGDENNAFRVTATRDAAGVLTLYAYDDAGRIYGMDRSGQRYYIATDHLGSPRSVTGANGVEVKALTYDSWGVLTVDTNPSFALPIGFAGGLGDTTAGLVRFGLRDYEPAAGRWTSRDSALYDGQQFNLYAYVDNQPASHIDPQGLYAITAGICDAICGGGKLAWVPGKGASLSIDLGVGMATTSVEIEPEPEGGLEEDGLSVYAAASAKLGPLAGELKVESKMDDCGSFESPKFKPKACAFGECKQWDGPTTFKFDPKKNIFKQFADPKFSAKVKAGVKVSARLW